MDQMNGQYMDKPLPRDYEKEDEVFRPSFEGLREKLAEFPRPKISKGQIRALKMLLLALVVVLLLLKAVDIVVGSKSTATRYFKASVVDGDAARVYHLLDLPESVFLTKDQFVFMHGNSQVADITNYEVSDANSVAVGGFLEAPEELPDFIANYKVQYTIRGEDRLQQENYQLVKTGKILPNWKVSPTGLVAREVSIYAPENVSLQLDGILLSEEHLSQTDNYYYEGYKCYVVDVFAGNHTIYAEAKYMEPAMFDVTFYDSGDSYEVPELALSGTTEYDLQNILAGFVEETYKMADLHHDPDPMPDKLTENGQMDFDDIYAYMMESKTDNSYILQYKNTEVSGFAYELRDVYWYEGKCYVSIAVYYDYSYEYQRKGWDGMVYTESESSYSDAYATFMLDGDTWKIDELSMRSIY